MRYAEAFHRVHVVALALCMAMLPWSTAFLSIAQMLLAAGFLAGGMVRGDLVARFRQAFTSGPVLVFLSFLGLHLLGLSWSSDPAFGLDLVRILLPVLVFGVVLGGSPRLSKAELRAVLLTGAWSAVVSAAVCLLLADAQTDHRGLSRFVSHIRLSMMLALAVGVFLQYQRGLSLMLRVVHVLAAAFALFFIAHLGSLQAVVMLAIIAMVLGWRWAARLRRGLRLAARTLMLLPLPLVMAYLVWVGRDRLMPPPAELGQRMEYSAGGEPYVHDLNDRQTENGHHVWTYVAWHELYRTWPLRSAKELSGNDAKGHPLSGTLVRYLASKGLRKDSVSLMALSDADITAIEGGVTNAHHAQRSALRRRVDQLYFELERYLGSGDANGHSLTMRIEFQRTGLHIVRTNPWVGVGTGGNRAAFAQAYEETSSRLLPENRHRAHNQFLTLLIAFGPLGLLWSVFTWWWPAWREGAWSRPLFIAWAVIFGISCLVDDTIETQTGATFFAMYYAVLVFAAPKEP